VRPSEHSSEPCSAAMPPQRCHNHASGRVLYTVEGTWLIRVGWLSNLCVGIAKKARTRFRIVYTALCVFRNETGLELSTWRAMGPFSITSPRKHRSLKPRYSLGRFYVSLLDVQLGYAFFVCISLALVPRELGGSLHISSSFRPACDDVTGGVYTILSPIVALTHLCDDSSVEIL
jgi:hypothetical protein